MSQELDPASECHFEYTVPSLGRARASSTDLVILSGETATAIEGKSTEPRYETVAEWLFKSERGREHVLAHWAGHTSAVTGSPTQQVAGACVYQMFHCLAPLCSIDRYERRLAYQVSVPPLQVPSRPRGVSASPGHFFVHVVVGSGDRFRHRLTETRHTHLRYPRASEIAGGRNWSLSVRRAPAPRWCCQALS